MDTLTKAFLDWANWKGYDTAHAYNQNESRWMFLSPMTADLYEAWQAAQSEQSTELERLRKDAERMRNALVDIADWTDRYTKPGHPISTVARRAIAGEKS